MKAVIKVTAINGTNEFAVTTIEELEEATTKLDRAGTDYAIDYKRV